MVRGGKGVPLTAHFSPFTPPSVLESEPASPPARLFLMTFRPKLVR